MGLPRLQTLLRPLPPAWGPQRAPVPALTGTIQRMGEAHEIKNMKIRAMRSRTGFQVSRRRRHRVWHAVSVQIFVSGCDLRRRQPCVHALRTHDATVGAVAVTRRRWDLVCHRWVKLRGYGRATETNVKTGNERETHRVTETETDGDRHRQRQNDRGRMSE